jgi:hypothetical protein
MNFNCGSILRWFVQTWFAWYADPLHRANSGEDGKVIRPSSEALIEEWNQILCHQARRSNPCSCSGFSSIAYSLVLLVFQGPNKRETPP